MPGNLHSLGMALQEAMRPEIANHEIKLQTCKGLSEAISSSSPPIGQELITEAGIDFANHNRVFYIEVADLVTVGLGLPELGWFVIDTKDNTRWRVLPQDNEYGWRWHGQHRTSVQVLTKLDGTCLNQ